MKALRRKPGMGEQLAAALVAALTDVNGAVPPEPKTKRRSGLRSVAVGAALFTTGRGLAKLRGHAGTEEVVEDEHPRARVRGPVHG